MSAATVTPGTPCLLIIALQTFGNIVVDHIPNIWLVNTHTKRNRRHDHIHFLIEERILIGSTCGCIHTRMVRRHLNTISSQQLGQLLNLFAAQTIDNARLAGIIFNISDDLFIDVDFGTNLIKQIGTIERRFENRCIQHPEIFLNIHLHLRRSRSGQRNQRCRTNIIDDRSDTTILRPEIVSPLGNTVCLINGIKRYFDLAQKRYVILFGQRLRSEIEQFGLPGQHITFDLGNGCLVERGVQKMGNPLLHAERTHGIHLILHQRNQRGDHNATPSITNAGN